MPTPSTSAGSEAAPAQLFDGETATRHLVIISPWAGGLQLAGDFDQLLARSELRILTAGATRTVLGLSLSAIASGPIDSDRNFGIFRM